MSMSVSRPAPEKKLLIVSYCYPPFPAMGSSRIASFVRHLPSYGWKAAVVTIRPGKYAPFQTAPSEDESPELVCRTPTLDIARLLHALAGGRLRGNSVSRTRARRGGGWSRLALEFYDRFLAFPDAAWPWYFLGRRQALSFARLFGPDAVLSSSPPETAHVFGEFLARTLGVPWVADFRDPWSQSPWRDFSPRARTAARRLELKVISGARALCAVSEPIARELAALHGKEAFTVTNGFEPGPPAPPPPSGPFRIVYTGMVYPGRREPGTLFEAVRLLRAEGAATPQSLRLVFYGPNHHLTRELAAKQGVSEFVDCPGETSRDEALAVQRGAHLLLQLEWEDPRAAGVYPGKFFEYLGAGRPILAIGPRDSVVERTLRASGAGTMAHDARQAAAALRAALERWRQGRPEPHPRDEAELSRHTGAFQAGILARKLDALGLGKGGG